MKKVVLCLVTLGLSLMAVVGFADQAQNRQSRISLVLAGGLGYCRYGDIGTSLRDIDAILISGDFRGYSKGRLSGLDSWTINGEAEARLRVIGNFSLGLAVSSPLHLSPESRVLLYSYFTDPRGSEAGSFMCIPDVRMRPPVKLGAYYSLPLKSNLSLVIGAGVGTYSGRISESIDYELADSNGSVWYRGNWSAAWKSTIGIHGILGAEYGMSRRVALIANLTYRHVKIAGFSAEMSAESNLWTWPRNFDPQGELWAWSWGEDGPMGIGYQELIVWSGNPPNHRPLGGGPVRPAVLDLSGLSMSFGLKIAVF
jgi:hypothetical protein